MWIYRLESLAVIFAMTSAGLFFVGLGTGCIRYVVTTSEKPDGALVSEHSFRIDLSRTSRGEIHG